MSAAVRIGIVAARRSCSPCQLRVRPGVAVTESMRKCRGPLRRTASADQVDAAQIVDGSAQPDSFEDHAGDAELSRNLSEIRLVKDAYEIEQMPRDG